MTEVINQLPGSTFFAIIFFLMLVSLGLSSMFGFMEGICSSLKDLETFKKVRNEFLMRKCSLLLDCSFSIHVSSFAF